MTGLEIISLFKSITSPDFASGNFFMSGLNIINAVTTFRNQMLRTQKNAIRTFGGGCFQTTFIRRSSFLHMSDTFSRFDTPRIFIDAFGNPVASARKCGFGFQNVSDVGMSSVVSGIKGHGYAKDRFFYDNGSQFIGICDVVDIIEVRAIFENPVSVPGFSLASEFPCPIEYISYMRDWAAKYKKPITSVNPQEFTHPAS